MKKTTGILIAAALLLGLTACGAKQPTTTDTLAPADLTPREQMLAGSQDIFLYDFEASSAYTNVRITIEDYKNGVRGDDIASLACRLPENAAQKGGSNTGSLAVILSVDHRFTASVCNKDGGIISSATSAEQTAVGKADFEKIRSLVETPITIDGNTQDLVYLVFSDAKKTQGAFEESIFLDPVAHEEQTAAFDHIYLVKCRFYA